MQYAILCYDDEKLIEAWTKAREQEVMTKHRAYSGELAAKGKLGTVLRLLPTTAATTIRADNNKNVVFDGPFAETKEQLLGFWIVDVESHEEAIAIAQEFSDHKGTGSLEIRPLMELVNR